MSTPTMPPTPAPEPSHSYVWMVLVAIVIIVAAAALYWVMIMPPSASQEQAGEVTQAQVSAEADLVAAEIEALSTDTLDAELGQIDTELLQ